MTHANVVTLLTFSYIAFSMFRVAFYYPQIRRVLRSKDASDISVPTWLIWTANNAMGALYSSVVLADIWLSLVFISNMLCTAFITQVARAKQQRASLGVQGEWQSSEFSGSASAFQAVSITPTTWQQEPFFNSKFLSSSDRTTDLDGSSSPEKEQGNVEPTLPDRFYAENAAPPKDWIFVFGSTVNGRHSRGQAKVAFSKFGARHAISSGLVSRSYAIPVAGKRGYSVSMVEIERSVVVFLDFAVSNPRSKFYITRMGDKAEQLDEIAIAKLFCGAPPNCCFPVAWRSHIDPSI